MIDILIALLNSKLYIPALLYVIYLFVKLEVPKITKARKARVKMLEKFIIKLSIKNTEHIGIISYGEWRIFLIVNLDLIYLEFMHPSWFSNINMVHESRLKLKEYYDIYKQEIKKEWKEKKW